MTTTDGGKLASSTRPRVPARAEVIGSLLRPERLKQAIRDIYAPGHTALLAEERRRDLSDLHALEDDCIRSAVRRQVECGLDVVTDGEFRRYMFTGSFYDGVDGLRAGVHKVPFKGPDGEVQYYDGLPVVERPLQRVSSPGAREIAFVKSLTEHPAKVTFPAASIFWFPITYVAGVTDQAYPSHGAMVEDMIRIERDQVADAIAAGADYVQFDWPTYPVLGDPTGEEFLRGLGHDPARFLDALIEADRRVVEGIPGSVRKGLHLCRGNWKSRWIYEGSIEPYAERLFNELPYDVFLIEWEDTGREGTFEPLRLVPEGPVVAMGIQSSKDPRVESVDELVARIEEASRYLDVDQLAISPQCGFASTMHGNELDEGTQWRKLEVLAEAADRIWGR